MKTPLLGLAVALTFAACNGSSSPTSATVTSVPTGTTNWLVTQRFISVTGPDNCWVREQRARWTGAVFPELPMVVTRTGSSIAVTGDFFQVNYAGTVNGNGLSTTGVAPLEASGGRCQDGTSFPQMAGISRVSGTFSEDQTLKATEVNTYPLTSGGDCDVHLGLANDAPQLIQGDTVRAVAGNDDQLSPDLLRHSDDSIVAYGDCRTLLAKSVRPDSISCLWSQP